MTAETAAESTVAVVPRLEDAPLADRILGILAEGKSRFLANLEEAISDGRELFESLRASTREPAPEDDYLSGLAQHFAKPSGTQEALQAATEMMQLTPEEAKTAIVVTNVSPDANGGTLVDFFSFCGTIKKLHLEQEPGATGRQVACVVFSDAAAAETALLLSNAVIIDKPVAIMTYAAASNPQPAAPAGAEAAASAEPAKKGFFSSLKEKAAEKMKNLDSERGVLMTKLKAGTNKIADNMREAGKAIEEKMRPALEAAGEVGKKIDEKTHISEFAGVVKTKTVAASQKVEATYKEVADKVENKMMESAVVQKGVAKMKEAKSKIGTEFKGVKSKIDAKLGRSGSSPTGEFAIAPEEGEAGEEASGDSIDAAEGAEAAPEEAEAPSAEAEAPAAAAAVEAN
eukprot:tig00000058_g747.t1